MAPSYLGVGAAGKPGAVQPRRSSASAGPVKQFDNDRQGIAKLIAWVTPCQPTRIIFQATGAYHRALEMAALPSVKINPLQARRFAEASGKRVKTDPVDAAMLARFGYTMQPDIPPARDETIDTLGELLPREKRW